MVLLMAEIPNNHLGCMKPQKQRDKLPTSTGAGFQPSTVLMGELHQEFIIMLTLEEFVIVHWDMFFG